MNKLILASLLSAAAAAPVAPALAADVGVSVSISQPGVYGRVDIGRFPQPQVVVTQPVVVQRPAVVVARPEPVYMWVPPGHRKNWRKHCGQYNACGVPVYFVQDQWYERHVHHPDRYHDHPGPDRGPGHGPDHGPGKGKHRD
jgi:hypothetical protein